MLFQIIWNGVCIIVPKMNTMKKTILFLLGAVIAFNFASAQKTEVVTNSQPGWHKIGETTVNFKADRDAIVILGEDKFKAIQLVVTDAPMHLEDLKVFYENDSTEDIHVRADFKANERTRVIDLRGKDRNLKRVVFVYKSALNWKGEKAHVELYGLK